jgi:acetyltransferase
VHKYKRNLELLYETPAELAAGRMIPKFHVKAIVGKALKQGTTALSAEESASLLDDYGISVVKTRVTQSVEMAARAAKDIGYPVVLKIASPDIPHKTEVGGVVTGIGSEEDLKEVYKSLTQTVKDLRPDAVVKSVIVQKMVEKIDYEVLIGVKKDPEFGSVIAFGMGGIGTEIFRDVAVGLPPLNQTLALRLMEETMVYRMLQGCRGKAPANIRQLESILVQFSNLVADFPEIAEMDINPLAISGGSAFALDVNVVLEAGLIDHGTPYPHLAITPYPTRYVMPTVLMDGTEVLLRPIRPEDEPLEHEMLTTLSERTLRQRFLNPIKEITHDMLIRFCNIDYERQMAIVAEIRDSEKKRIVGIGRLTLEPDLRSGQFAVLVHDDFHGRGLGYTLIDSMIGIAQDKSLEEIYGIVLSENDRMLNLCRKLGLKRTLMPDGISRVSLMLK